MADINVSNPTQLADALQSASGGDIIHLASGGYGALTISARNFTSNVTIVSADAGQPAVFDSLSIKGSSNIIFQGVSVAFSPTITTTSSSTAVLIDGSHGISFDAGVIVGGPAISGVLATATALDTTGNVIGEPTARGISILRSSDVTVHGSDISSFMRGVVISASDRVTLSDNEIHDLRKTAIVGGGSDLLIQGNYLHDSHPWHWGVAGGDHADFIALWTLAGQTGPTNNVVIRDNVLAQGAGAPVLGLWLSGDAAGFTNVTVDGNAILGGDHQGIMMSNTTGGRIINNVLLQTGTDDHPPGILLLTGSSGIDVSHNVTWFATDQTANGNAIHENIIAQNTNTAQPNFYDAVLVNEIVGLTHADDIQFIVDRDLGHVLTNATPTGGTLAVVAGVTLVGNSAANVLTGGAGADRLEGHGGADTLTGGAGNDTYVVPNGLATIVEKSGQGNDTVIASGNYVLGANIENLTLATATNGWSATGNELANVLTGNAGNNVLTGLAGNDTLSGAGGSDSLLGGDGNDLLLGGVGSDTLTGGAGADIFSFGAIGESTFGAGGRDVILDFNHDAHDIIDLSRIDPLIGGADDRFSLVAAFTHTAGQLTVTVEGDHYLVQGDVTGDGVADFAITVFSTKALVVGDFLL